MGDVQPLCTHEQLLGCIPVGIASLEGGILRYTNEAFATLHGATVKDLQGQRWLTYVSPIHHAVIQAVISQTTDTGKCWSGVLSIRRIDGQDRRLYCTIRPGINASAAVTIQEAEVGYGPGTTAIEELRALREATSTSNHGYWRWTLSSDEIEISRNFTEHLGYGASSQLPDTLQTNWFFDVIHPDDLRVAEAGYERYLTGQQPYWESEVRLRSADARWIRTSVRGCFVRWADDGKPMVMAGTFTNMEEAYTARQALDNLEQILTTIAATPIIDHDEQASAQHLTELLRMTLERMKVDSGSLVSLKRDGSDGYEVDVLGFIDHDGPVPKREQTRWTTAHEIEHVVTGDAVTLQPENPMYGEVADLMPPFPAKRALYVIPLRTERSAVGCIVTNASEQPVSVFMNDPVGSLLLSTIARILEIRTYRESLDALQRRNDDLVEDIGRMQRSWECGARATDGLLAGVSHELRQPLSAILSTTETLIEGVYGALSASQSVRVMDVHESASHLLSLINDMLDVSMARIGTLSIERSNADVVSVVSSAVTMLRPLADQKNIAIRIASQPSEPFMVDLDVRRIKQVVVNLVANAIKFTPEWGEVVVDVRGRTFDTEVCISIADNGIGIAADQLPRLFEPFAQADASVSGIQQGSGLGLPIVAYIVDAHDGILEAQSTPGVGSTFTVCLPWKPIPTGTQVVPQTKQRRTSMGSVVVVDVNPMFRSQVKSLLSERGYRVESVAEGLHGIEGNEARRDTVIIVGVQRIDAHVKHSVRRIMESAQRNKFRPRIIVMPAIASQVDVEDLRAEGVHDVLPKAVADHLLVKAVADATRNLESDVDDNSTRNISAESTPGVTQQY